MLKAQKEAHQMEMSTELTQTLTSQEQRRLEELITKIEQMRERLSNFSTSRSEVCKVNWWIFVWINLLIYINVA